MKKNLRGLMSLCVLLLSVSAWAAQEQPNIVSRTAPVSTMPPMGLILQKQELRDLIAFLARQK